MSHKVTCIICPKSCIIETKIIGNEIITLGEGCNRGKKYAITEVTDPRRIFTSTVLIGGSDLRVVPVRTTKPIRKNDWKKAKKIIEKLKLNAPVDFGKIIISDFLEQGINLIVTREVMKDNNF
ncbi:MAG: DUF1667 domain-containing protein [Actinobacteria bacterium]|nr:DUF1667 domain-containing protein [Actinomycetota bacterium]